MWKLEYKESWVPKNWCFWTVVLEKTLESPLDCKEIQPVHPKGDQAWVFIGRTDVEAETPKLWPPDVKSWLTWKDPDVGKDWGQEGKGTTEDEMVGWHHRLGGHGFGWTPGVGYGQRGLACCGSWGHRVRHNWVTELNWVPWLVKSRGKKTKTKNKNPFRASGLLFDKTPTWKLFMRKDRGQEEKGMTEDEMVEWQYWLNGHEFVQTPGDSEGQGSLVCWSPQCHKELDAT